MAYELLFRQGLENEFPNITPEHATNKLIADHFLSSPLQHLRDGYPFFVNFPASLLMEGLANSLPADQIVIEVLETAIPDADLLATVRQLKQQGYRIALDDFTMDPLWDPFLPFVDIIKFDIRTTSQESMGQFIRQHEPSHLQYLAEKIEDQEEFRVALELGCHLFQGYFFSRPEVVQRKALSANQQTVMQLLRAVNQEPLDFDFIEQILNSDVSLSYKLLRYTNNLRYRVANPITSFRQAAMFLGNKELRRFVSLVATTSAGVTKSPEIYHMSMVRARFCELLSLHRASWTDPGEAFLCGLFSLLNALLDQPFEQILQDISVPEKVASALLHHKGELAFYLAFICDLESANWNRLQKRTRKIGLDEQVVTQLYVDATQWASEVAQH